MVLFPDVGLGLPVWEGARCHLTRLSPGARRLQGAKDTSETMNLENFSFSSQVGLASKFL